MKRTNKLSKLEQIRVILGLHKFETAVLIDGVTTVEADAFTEGATLYVVDEAGNKTAAPAGQHETADLVITVDDAGVITSVTAKSKEEIVGEPIPVAAKKAAFAEGEEMPKEAIAEIVSEIVEEKIEESMTKKFEDAIKEEVKEEMRKKFADVIDEEVAQMTQVLAEVAEEVAKVKEEVEMMKGKFAKFAKEPGAEPLKKAPNALYESFDALESKVSKLAKFKAEFGKQK